VLGGEQALPRVDLWEAKVSRFQFTPRARNPIPLVHHAIMAERYSDWAQQQVDRANQTLNPKARHDRLALAEYYLQLSEAELAASRRIAGQTIQEKPDAAIAASASNLPPVIADGITETSAISL
jgi:hypothetical protein